MRLIQVLGPGCGRCEQLKKNAEAAAKSAGIEAVVEKITDINVITGFGVMATPGLVIDGELKISGKVASPEEIKKFLT